MSIRNTVQASILSALALTMLCLCSSVANAQKGTPSTDGSVKPVRGIDVIVKKNPGNTAVRTATTNDEGEVTFTGLAPGNYSLTIVDHSNQQKIKNGSISGDVLLRTYSVKIDGAVGGPIEREWDVKESKFAAASNVTAKTQSPEFKDSIDFEIGSGPPKPLQTSISKSRSNVKNNARTNNVVLTKPSPKQ